MLRQENYDRVLIDKQDGVALLTLNRPERLNAADEVLHSELSTLFFDIQSDRDTKVAVLTGAGRAFSAGGDFSTKSGLDLSPHKVQEKSGLTMAGEARRIVDGALGLDKPVIAAMNGHATGLGATIALLCDIVIAARTARIGDPHVKMGLTAGDGGGFMWPLLVGVNRAKYMLMTGDLITAEEAYAWGLVNKVVDEGEAVPEALALAQRLAGGAQIAIRSSKLAVNNIIRLFATVVLPASIPMEEVSILTEDHQEAVRAFQEKRPPHFRGR
jgi:enoyl-CoA hydratase